jgi:NOL1/NOP2/fmu family ribosome biogenesis protein
MQGEGFFIAGLRKHGTYQPPARPEKTPPLPPVPKADATQLLSWSRTPEGLGAYMVGDTCILLPEVLAPAAAQVVKHLHVIFCGVEAAQRKGKDLIPQHALALWTGLKPDVWTQTPLELPEALAFLKKETIPLDAPGGWTLITYRGLPLGFAKQIGHRMNNYYPQHWKIRMNLPATLPVPFWETLS